jgi:hypothetical protein
LVPIVHAPALNESDVPATVSVQESVAVKPWYVTVVGALWNVVVVSPLSEIHGAMWIVGSRTLPTVSHI